MTAPETPPAGVTRARRPGRRAPHVTEALWLAWLVLFAAFVAWQQLT